MRDIPNAQFSEQVILSSLLMDTKCRWRANQIDADWFFNSANRIVFNAIKAEVIAGRDFDAVSIGEGSGCLDDCIGLVQAHPTSAAVQSHIDSVRDAYQRRRLIAACTDGIEAAYIGKAAPAIDGIISAVDSLAIGSGGQASSFSDVLDMASDEVNASRAAAQTGSVVGIPTGIPFLDNNMGGLRRKRLVIVGARPSWGKTAITLQAALHGASHGHPAGIASLEMTKPELGMRAICNLTGMNFGDVQKGRKAEEFSLARNQYRGFPLTIDDARTDIGDIVSWAHELKYQNNIGLLVVDYIGLIRGGAGETTRERMADYTRRLKRLAKELDICVVLIVQLNRNCEIEKRRPIMADIRDCGDIEQDADVVLALNPKSQFVNGCRDMELGFLKSRLCAPGWAQNQFQFDGRSQRFLEIDSRWDQE